MENRLKQLMQLHLLKTLYVNIKLLPFKQAVRLPIFIYRRVEICNVEGALIIDTPLRTGMLQVGWVGNDFAPRHSWGQIYIDGILKIRGKVDFGIGSIVRVYKGGELSIGDNVIIPSFVKLHCEKEIVIGNNVRFAHECQIMDTNHHYIEKIETKEVLPCNGVISIGNNNWIANRTTITKGTVTPDFCIVGSGSLLNKDYTKVCPPNSMIAGVPAKLVTTGVRRILDFEEENKWNKHFGRIAHYA
jgi:acetyltransferase-like isoleucine patch superfamily enzyme